MRPFLAAFALIAVAACGSPPAPGISPTPALSPAPPAAATVHPCRFPALPGTTEQVGLLTITHPIAWQVVLGPKGVVGRSVPLFYVSNAPLVVGACPTPARNGMPPDCPAPVTALAAGSVLITVNPNPGPGAIAPDGRCRKTPCR